MRTYLCINGIRQDPSKELWTDKAASFFDAYPEESVRGDKYEYKVGLIKSWSKRKHIDGLKSRIATLSRSTAVYPIAHSHGCELVICAIKETDVFVPELHLFAPAIPRSFERNHLNDLSEKIGHLFLYGSRNDKALIVGGVSRFLFGWAGLGYGDLGRTGPEEVSVAWTKPPMRLTTVWKNEYDHGTWFDGENLEKSMSQIVRSEAS